MKIGTIELSGPLRLAPMAGLSNAPFRLVCRELGSSLVTSEEIRAQALVDGNRGSLELASWLPEEKPVAIQLLGSEPEPLAAAARIVEGLGADIVDLNMGCPVWKITRNGAGSALMRDPLKAAGIFRAMRRAVRIPLTIKIRGGWDEGSVNAAEIARIAEAEGVDAVAVHPRTRAQQNAGLAPREIIRQVVEAVKIPVTGNGDVRSWADAERMMAETGCASVMIGRGALGRPWVFHRGFEALCAAAQAAFKRRVILRHMELIQKHMAPRWALLQMKKQLVHYERTLKPAELFARQTPEAVLELLHAHWGAVPA